MLYVNFTETFTAREYIERLYKVRQRLEPYSEVTDEYTGQLRRHVLAKAVHYSTSIEGNTLTLAQVQSLVAGEEVAAPAQQVQEVQNYKEAIAYVQSLVGDGDAVVTEDVIRTIHFVVSKGLTGYGSGRYRTEQNYVVDRNSGKRVFHPPSPSRVPGLMREFVEWANTSPHLDSVYRAGLAHLNFVAIHPFTDGNGRTARVLETLLLYKGGFRGEDLISLEEYFGLDTRRYYEAIADSLGPVYSPPGNASRWIEYYLRAHLEQAQGALRDFLTAMYAVERLESTFQLSLFGTAAAIVAHHTGTVTNRSYRSFAGRSAQTAAADLKRLTDIGLFERQGRGRAVSYRLSDDALRIWEQARDKALAEVGQA